MKSILNELPGLFALLILLALIVAFLAAFVDGVAVNTTLN